MFIGHLPGAYLLTKVLAPKTLSAGVFASVMVGSVSPDLDMLWFYLVDRSTHHHHFITHRPLIWLGVLLFGLIIRRPMLAGLGVGALIHCMLDSIAGDILWLWPLSDHGFQLVEVQPTHDHWIKSFLHHWTFKVEILITIIAAIVFIRSKKKGPDKTSEPS